MKNIILLFLLLPPVFAQASQHLQTPEQSLKSISPSHKINGYDSKSMISTKAIKLPPKQTPTDQDKIGVYVELKNSIFFRASVAQAGVLYTYQRSMNGTLKESYSHDSKLPIFRRLERATIATTVQCVYA